jgi:hypothetical protein
VPANSIAIIAELVDRWDLDSNYLGTANNNVKSVVANLKQVRDVMDGFSDEYLTAAQKYIVTIVSDSTLSFPSLRIESIISSGLSAVSANTVSAATDLQRVNDVLKSRFPLVRDKTDTSDTIMKYLQSADHVYSEFAAAMLPERNVSGLMFTDRGLYEHSFVPFDQNGSDTVAVPAAYGDIQPFNSGDSSLTHYNNNAGTVGTPGAQNTIFNCIYRGLNDSLYYAAIAATGGSSSSVELPIFRMHADADDTYSVTISVRHLSALPHHISRVEDGTGFKPVVIDTTVTGWTVRLRDGAGVLVATRTGVSSTGDRVNYVHFDGIEPGSYVTFQPGVGSTTPASNYAGNFFELAITDQRLTAPHNLGRIIDVVANTNHEFANVPEIFTHGVIEGLGHLKEINEWLDRTGVGDIPSMVNAYYQGVRVAADTAATLGEEVLDMGWWLGSGDGISKNTRMKCYRFFYSVSTDMLRMSSCSREFAEYILTG